MTATVEPQSPQGPEGPEVATGLEIPSAPQALWSSMPGWGIVANLLPPELIDARRAHAMRKIVACAAIAIVVLAGLTWGYEKWRSSSASSDLAKSQQTTRQLTASQNEFGDVVQIKGDVAAVQAKVATLMTNDVDYPALIATMTRDQPTEMVLTAMSISVNSGFSASGVTNSNSNSNTSSNLDLSGAQHIGTVTLTGIAARYTDVSAYVTKLGLITGVTQVYPVSSIAGPEGVQFSVQITLTDKLLTHRFTASTAGAKSGSNTGSTTGGH
jgi:hypothetical protein